jgi:NAD(P)-dependent dehydrogenase (short-subunit alcohol dehydrogenase family)
MPFVGNSITPRDKASCFKTYDFLRKTSLYFTLANAWTCPNADTYVRKLFQEAPEAKEAVKGKLAIVTGVTIGGAGYFMAEELAVTAEMHVILMGRNEGKLTAAMESIVKTAEKRGAPKPTLYETKYDLNSLKSAVSAAEYATKLAADKYDGKIHVLVNNAGGCVPKYDTTEEGIEANVGRNYVAPHFLTEKLIPVLKKAAISTYKPRVVFVASIAHIEGTKLDPERLLNEPSTGGAPEGFIDPTEKKFTSGAMEILDATKMYCLAKFGAVADAIALAKKHPEINFTSQQPGSILSNFGNELGIAGAIYYYGFYFFQFQPSQGACTALRAALDPDFNREESLQGAYLNCDRNPWYPAEATVKDPDTNEIYDMNKYCEVLLVKTNQMIAALK